VVSVAGVMILFTMYYLLQFIYIYQSALASETAVNQLQRLGAKNGSVSLDVKRDAPFFDPER
jgi:hypothetical protein